MLYKEELKIIELFRLDPFAEITLQEIMQKLGKKSYNWTYLAVQKLSKKQILTTRKIGKTIVAKLNFDSPKTITYLIYLERIKAKKDKLIDKIKKITPFFVLIKNKQNKIAIVNDENTKKQLKNISNLKILTKNEFKQFILTKDSAKNFVKENLVLYGAEFYYEILLEVTRGIR